MAGGGKEGDKGTGREWLDAMQRRVDQSEAAYRRLNRTVPAIGGLINAGPPSEVAAGEGRILYHVEDGTQKPLLPGKVLGKPVRIHLTVAETPEGTVILPGKVGRAQEGTIRLDQLVQMAHGREDLEIQIGRVITGERSRIRRSGTKKKTR